MDLHFQFQPSKEIKENWSCGHIPECGMASQLHAKIKPKVIQRSFNHILVKATGPNISFQSQQLQLQFYDSILLKDI